MVLRIFKISPSFERLACFYVTVSESKFLKQIFWKTKNFFKKLEYSFLIETNEIENASFPFKTALPETILRQIEWQLQNGPITKGGVLPVSLLFFGENFFSFRTF